MIIRDENQALAVAVEMERRAIRTYERALMLAENPEVRRGIEDILQDERQHLCRFAAMQPGTAAAGEEGILTEAMAAEVLFTGGVAEMNRAKAMTTLRGLYEFAAESERQAVEKYSAFADKAERPDVKEAFLAIAAEEKEHLQALEAALVGMK